MIVGHAYRKMFTFIKEDSVYYLPYFFFMLILGYAEFYFMTKGESFIFIALFFSLLGIIMQVSFLYSLNYKYGLRKGDLSFYESLWSGLCFTPGYVLEMIKLLLRFFLGLCLLILPGIYFGLKHGLDPYYTLINSEGSPYRKSFTKNDLWDVAQLLLPFAVLTGLLLPPWGQYVGLMYLDYVQTTLITMISLVGLVTIFFYINFLEKERSKSC